MDKALNFFSRLKSVWAAARTPTDEERARRDSIGERHGRAIIVDQAGVSAELQQFRLLVGISQDSSFRAPHGFNPNQLPIDNLASRSAPNMGIYTRVYTREIKCKNSFKNTSRLINTCLGTQIVVAAALTALGAANGSRSAVTVFGAINTIIAGFLTYLKGSGLPNRYKYYQHEWAKVREYIEQRERDLSCGHSFDVQQEVGIIRQMYESVLVDVEANQPDRFVGVGAMRGPMMMAPVPALSRPATVLHKSFSDASSDANHLYEKSKTGIESRVRDVVDLEKGLESYGKTWYNEKHTQAAGAMDNINHAFSGFKTRLEQKARDVGHLEKELEDQGRNAVEDKRREAAGIVDSTIRDANAFGSRVTSATAAAVSERQRSMENEYQHRSDALGQAFSLNRAASPGTSSDVRYVPHSSHVSGDVRASAAASHADTSSGPNSDAAHMTFERPSSPSGGDAGGASDARAFASRALDGISPSSQQHSERRHV